MLGIPTSTYNNSKFIFLTYFFVLCYVKPVTQYKESTALQEI